MANGFGSLYVGASGIQSSQNGLNVIANNIANVDTPGYVRQQVVYEDKSYNKFAEPVAISPMKNGLGVAIGDVVHARDQFLDRSYRTENGRHAFYDTHYEATAEVETLLNEQNGSFGTSFAIAIQDFDDAFNEFATRPADEVSQNLIAQKADLFITRAQAAYQGLKDYQSNINNKIKDKVDRINELGKQIYKLNLEIQKIESGNVETAMDLRDVRDSCLDELSELADIEYTEMFDGFVKVKLEGSDFVIESRAYTIGLKEDLSTGFYNPYWEQLSIPKANKYDYVFDDVMFADEADKTKINVDPTKNNDIGEVKALMLIRGNRPATYMDLLAINYDATTSVDNMSFLSAEQYQKSVANSVMLNEEAELDTLVHHIVTAINNLLSPIMDASDNETVQSLEGKADLKIIESNGEEIDFEKLSSYKVFDEKSSCYGSDKKLPPQELFSRVGVGRYRQVTYSYTDDNGDTVTDSLYVYNEEGVPKIKDVRTGDYVIDNSKVYTLKSISINQSVMEDPSLIAHRHQNDDIAYDLGANIYALWKNSDYMLNPSDETPCGFADFYTKMVGELATAGNVYKTVSESLESTKATVESNRQAVIGVSTDEELQTMIKFQNAYNASSRYMNVVSEMIQTLITSMGA